MSCSCSILGSLCKSISEKCSINFCGTSNKNTIIYGLAEQGTELRRKIADPNAAFLDVVESVHNQSDKIQMTPITPVRKLSVAKDGPIDIESRAGVASITAGLLKSMKWDDEPLYIGMKRVKLAAALCSINLKSMFVSGTPITNEQVVQLEKAAMKVAKYQLAAESLWRKGYRANFDLHTLHTMANLPKKQLTYLEEQLEFVPVHRLMKQKIFWLLDLDMQKVFLEAAKYFPKEYLAACQAKDAWEIPLEKIQHIDHSSLEYDGVYETKNERGHGRGDSGHYSNSDTSEKPLGRRRVASVLKLGGACDSPLPKAIKGESFAIEPLNLNRMSAEEGREKRRSPTQSEGKTSVHTQEEMSYLIRHEVIQTRGTQPS